MRTPLLSAKGTVFPSWPSKLVQHSRRGLAATLHTHLSSQGCPFRHRPVMGSSQVTVSTSASAAGHTPVLRDEAIAGLSPRAGGRYIDGTFGGGGHTRELL